MFVEELVVVDLHGTQRLRPNQLSDNKISPWDAPANNHEITLSTFLRNLDFFVFLWIFNILQCFFESFND